MGLTRAAATSSELPSNLSNNLDSAAISRAMWQEQSIPTEMKRQYTPIKHSHTPSSSNVEHSSPTKMQRQGSSPKPECSDSSGLMRRLSSPSSLIKKLSSSKEKVSPRLRHALDLLDLRDLEGLEVFFLKTDAFLRPWTQFRDNFLLLQPNGMPRSSFPDQITRTDILYFYTVYDEGQLRYDPRADEDTSEYTADLEKYGTINTSFWGVVEWEKLLYVWLLQSFKVGKSSNPYGFEYFECRNPCTAYEDVFVPIIDVVRKDYNLKGRYHYGRLAKIIEEASPSKLGFPEATYGTTQASKCTVIPPSFTFKRRKGEIDPVTGMLRSQKKVWDEDERELRLVYPQYGQVVERPKFKSKIEDWIREQRDLMQRKKALRHLEGGISSTPHSPMLQGKTIPLVFAGDPGYPLEKKPGGEDQMKRQFSSGTRHRRTDSDYSDPSLSPSSPCRPGQIRRSSDGVYSSVRSSNPFSYDETPVGARTSEEPSCQVLNNSDRYVTVSVEAKPSPLDQPFGEHKRNPSNVSSYSASNWVAPNSWGTRYPSYESTTYPSPSLATLREIRTSEKVRSTRIPSPIDMPPIDSVSKYHPLVEKAVAHAGIIPITCEPPILPTKNPRRYNSLRDQVPSSGFVPQFSESAGMLGPRIISKENIRAAIGNLSRENSEELLKADVRPRKVADGGTQRNESPFARIGGRGLNLGESPTLPTFNTHLFPRNGTQTPVGAHKKGL